MYHMYTQMTLLIYFKYITYIKIKTWKAVFFRSDLDSPIVTTCPKLLGLLMSVQFQRWCRNWCLHSWEAMRMPSPTATIASGEFRHISRCRWVSPGTRLQITSAPNAMTPQTSLQTEETTEIRRFHHEKQASWKNSLYPSPGRFKIVARTGCSFRQLSIIIVKVVISTFSK